MVFVKATKEKIKLRMAIDGPSGSGKTYTAMNIAQHLVPGGKIAVIDTERRSARKYSQYFQFDVDDTMDTFHPQRYIDRIREAEKAGYDVLIIDSLTHAWIGKDGALALVDQETKRSQSKNSFNAWREITPIHNALVDAILAANIHVIVTLRTKTEYVVEQDDKGKNVPRKIGMAPVQRDGMEYEFDVVADMDLDNNMVISKTRCVELAGKVFPKPGEEIATILRNWLSDGAEREVPRCACGNEIEPISGFTAEEIAAKSKEKFDGEILCKSCRAARKEPQAAMPSVEEPPTEKTSATTDDEASESKQDEQSIGDKCREAQRTGNQEPVTGSNANANASGDDDKGKNGNNPAKAGKSTAAKPQGGKK